MNSTDFDAYFHNRHGELPVDRTSEEYANKLYLKHEMFKAWQKSTNEHGKDFESYFLNRHGELPEDHTSKEYEEKSYLKLEMHNAWQESAKSLVE